jgi:broad specificity phosphatase PhoE
MSQTAPNLLQPGLTLYFVRHGETDWNRVQRYQGQTDIPLNDTGRAQAARNGAALDAHLGAAAADLDFVSSPQVRASETMQIIRRELGLAVDDFARDDRLKEQHFGHWEGQLYAALPTLDPTGFTARRADPWHWTPNGGESYVMLAERVGTWLGALRRDTIVTSHGNVSRVVRHLVVDIARADVPTLPVPQNKVLRLRDGAADWI